MQQRDVLDPLAGLEAELRKCSDEVAQEKEVWNRHRDEDMNTLETAKRNDLLARDAVVHVMSHAEKAISGATMELAGQLQGLLRPLRGREEPTALHREITRQLEQEFHQSRHSLERRQCELRRDAAQLTVLRESCTAVIACHASKTKGNRRGDTDTGSDPCPACGCQHFFERK